jgi:leader peptidase (prepilin peptidase)/N-methyltransferase
MPFALFAIGLIVGSFLNAVIHRLYTSQSIVFDRSRCPHCHHHLGVSELIPLASYIFLRGKCRHCHKKISYQYPLVELITGVGFFLIGLHANFELSVTMIFNLIFLSFLVVIAVFDYKHFLILDKVVFPASIIALIYDLYITVVQNYTSNIHAPVISGFVGIAIISGFFGLQYLVSKGKWIGLGDVKLGIFLGLLFGVGQSLVLLMLSYFTGAIVGVGLIALYGKNLGSKLPFGTFLAFCGIIMLLYGPQIIHLYLSVLGI